MRWIAGVCVLGCFLLPHLNSQAQNAVQARNGPSLPGVIDIHAHCAPDVVPRSIDAFELARLAKAAGMRAVVLKNHYEETAIEAYMVRQAVPGIEVYGGIDLNRSVGGMNPEAVERMAHITGGYGKLVWMSTYDSQAQVKMEGTARPFVAISKDGELLPETKAVIAMIVKYHLVLATGHNSAAEDLLLLEEGKRQGVEQMVVTHGMLKPIHMSIEQMQRAARLGAYIEFVYNGITGSSKEFDAAGYARAIRAVGVQHVILSSDMGQPTNPVHTVGLALMFDALKKQGFTQSEIDAMSKSNPATLLGLAP